MESSHVYGGSEECHSNESGWTMYIGSPTTDDYEEDNLNSNNVNGDSYEEEENSDDSMASDASSGPSHWWVNGKIHSKNDKDSIVMMRGKNGNSDPKYNNPSEVRLQRRARTSDEPQLLPLLIQAAPLQFDTSSAFGMTSPYMVAVAGIAQRRYSEGRLGLRLFVVVSLLHVTLASAIPVFSFSGVDSCRRSSSSSDDVDEQRGFSSFMQHKGKDD
nr:acidic leucine-rich nuclear phosphoprotein 32 family member B-like [Ipomoea batatas]